MEPSGNTPKIPPCDETLRESDKKHPAFDRRRSGAFVQLSHHLNGPNSRFAGTLPKQSRRASMNESKNRVPVQDSRDAHSSAWTRIGARTFATSTTVDRPLRRLGGALHRGDRRAQPRPASFALSRRSTSRAWLTKGGKSTESGFLPRPAPSSSHDADGPRRGLASDHSIRSSHPVVHRRRYDPHDRRD